MDYHLDQECMNDWLQSYYSFAYKWWKNPTILKFPNKRSLNVLVQRHFFNSNPHIAEINAYSIYEEKEDRIVVTEALLDCMLDVLWNTHFERNRQEWLYDVERFLCCFHELGHLLLGHCQLCKYMNFSAIETSSNRAQIDTSVYQTLEMDADLFAVRRLAEHMMSIVVVPGGLAAIGYDDLDMLYYDTLCGIRAFSYVLCLQEMEEANRQYNISIMTGKPQQGRQPGQQTHKHPPSLSRGYIMGITFMEHLRKFFKIPDKQKDFEKIFYAAEEMFGGYTLSSKDFNLMYQYVLDGTFYETHKRMKWYWLSDIRKKLKPYSRITMGLLF